jgi:hypothetical protein
MCYLPGCGIFIVLLWPCFMPAKKQNIPVGIPYFKSAQTITIVLDGLTERYTTLLVFLKKRVRLCSGNVRVPTGPLVPGVIGY